MAMIEERNRLKKESKTLKTECKDKKKNLDAELERVKKHNEELAKKEHAEILKKIDDKYNAEYAKLYERRKKIAEQNRQITVIQRKIENCPSKIELQQYHQRFTELFESINHKFEENKRYVAIYNTKEMVKQLLFQQMGYFREIKSEFQLSKDKKQKDELAANLAGVITTLIENSNKTTSEINTLKSSKDARMNQLNQIL